MRAISPRCSNSKTRTNGLKNVAVYVHWPYCQSICNYCDFNKYVSSTVDHLRMKKCLIQQLSNFLQIKEKYNAQKPYITSIFFGGGTPSIAEVDTLSGVIDYIKSNYQYHKDIEITMEANPTSAEISKLKQFQKLGINRISLGIQALNDPDLRALGRQHSSTLAIEAIESAKEIFQRVSFDLIYGRHANHRVEDWKDELKKALAFRTGHVSLYNLTVEPGTLLNKKVQQGKILMPDEDLQGALYDACVEDMEEAGYLQYEISNFAIPGNESKHNMNYWMGGDFIGIGPGAASRITNTNHQKESYLQIKHPKKWMASVEENGLGIEEHCLLTTEEQLMELIMSGLRTTNGLSLSDEVFELLRHGKPIDEIFDLEVVDKYVHLGLLKFTNQQLCATRTGKKVLDSILPLILK